MPVVHKPPSLWDFVIAAWMHQDRRLYYAPPWLQKIIMKLQIFALFLKQEPSKEPKVLKGTESWWELEKNFPARKNSSQSEITSGRNIYHPLLLCLPTHIWRPEELQDSHGKIPHLGLHCVPVTKFQWVMKSSRNLKLPSVTNILLCLMIVGNPRMLQPLSPI